MNSSIKKVSFSLLRFFAFALLLTSSGCIKEYSYEYEPPPPPDLSAKYYLVGARGACSDAAQKGRFVKNIPLAADAFMTLTVDVTKAGTWSYATETENGYYFGGSGTFTNTGKQMITLQAIGTPAYETHDFFKLTIGGASCMVIVAVSGI